MSGGGFSLFGKKPTPEEYVKKWKRELKREERSLERTIRGIEMEEMKTQRQIKDLLKKGDKNSAKILAKELLRSRKAKERLYSSKAQLNSVGMQLTQQLSMLRLSKVIAKSTQIMGFMNSLIRLPELNKVMVAMAREMEKAGLIEEMMDETLSPEDEELDQAADEEVDKVIEEITMGVKTARVVTNELPKQEKDEEEEEDLSDLQSRLGALKS